MAKDFIGLGRFVCAFGVETLYSSGATWLIYLFAMRYSHSPSAQTGNPPGCFDLPLAGCIDRPWPLRVASTCNAMSRYLNGVLVRHRFCGKAGWFAATENMCMQHSTFYSGTYMCT